jgi:uncharacterized protein YbcI
MEEDDFAELAVEAAEEELQDPTAVGSDELREISRSIIQIFKFQFGRGPEGISTRYAGPDAIVSIVRNSLTPVERNIRDMGEHQRLRDIRMMFQHATEPEFRRIVEEITGRGVIAFTSGIDIFEDVCTEFFQLGPRNPQTE